jgi:hypothetical protein
MTLDQIKEQLSNRFIGVLAANRGYTIVKDEVDEGVDYTLKKTYNYTTPSGKTRHLTDGRTIDIQLKATTVNNIVDEGDNIKYDLEVKTFNDMRQRLANNPITPLILILYILPTTRDTWVELDDNELRLRRQAFWYRPDPGPMTDNEQRIRVTIPKTNILSIDCFDTLHTLFYP